MTKRATPPQPKRAASPIIPFMKGHTENHQDYMDSIKENIITICLGPAGTGKAQPLWCKIKTPTGWVKIGDLKIGDQVSTPNGKQASVIGVFDQGIKPTYKITFEDGRITHACGEHLFNVHYYEWMEPRTLSVDEISNLLKLKSKAKRLYVDLPKVSMKTNGDLPIDPYLLGALLGDGSFRAGVRFSSSDQFIVDKINHLLPENLTVCKYKAAKYDYSIISKEQNKNSLLESVKNCGLFKKYSYEKIIPSMYMETSYEHRIALLQGLMDTDGTVGRDGNVQFCTTSIKMAEQVQYLIRSIGGLCKIKEKISHFVYNGEKKIGKLAYILNIRCKDPSSLFSLPRKKNKLNSCNQYSDHLKCRIKSIEPYKEEECRCILIDDKDHLYITDDFVVTHNTYMAAGLAAIMLLEGEFNKIVLTRPIVECGEKIGFLPGEAFDKIHPYLLPLLDVLEEFLGKEKVIQYRLKGIIEICPLAHMRGRTFRNAVIVADELQNATGKQLKMLITRLGKDSKLVLNGDVTQSDLHYDENTSPLGILSDRLYKKNNVGVIDMEKEDIMRNEFLKEIIDELDKEF